MTGEAPTTRWLTRAGFEELCAGPVTGDTMALLEGSQHSHRRLVLRALLDQLHDNPAVSPEEAWRVLAEAEQRNPAAVADILMYPTVGVWLTRALHHTRPGRSTTWRELGYLNAIVAAAAIKCGHPATFRVPVSHGIVSLPTVGYVRVPGTFPVGAVDVVCAGPTARVQVNRTITIPLDGTDPAFTAARQHVSACRGLTLRAWIEHMDPYHGLGEPRPPAELTDSEFAEWSKLLHESWDVLTLNHPAHARELAAGLRSLGPIPPDVGTVGASSPAAFGAIRLSANESATEFAEALVHEMQHSKLNALLDLVNLTDDDHWSKKYLAPWRDDPRPLVGVVHGVYAFTCGVEFWLAQEPAVWEAESRQIAFAVAYRRQQVRRALRTLRESGHLTRLGEALVDAVSTRLAACEQVPVSTVLSRTTTEMIDDQQALWRLRYARPEAAAISSLAAAWLAGAPPVWPGDCHIVTDNDHLRLPANRRTLLRAKATEPDLFTSLIRRPAALPGTTPRADAAFCTGDYPGAAEAYEHHLREEPDDTQAWVGLGLALRAQGRNATALLERPELTVAVHRQVRVLGGHAPAPTALATWLNAAL